MDGAAEMGARLLADMSTDPYGEFSPSVYETARLISLAPELTGHQGRIRFLLAEQNAGGGWGRPDSYGLLPTLSATEALLTEFRRTHNPVAGLAAGRGLQALFTRTANGSASLPDTVAVEILAPSLIVDINHHLDELDAVFWHAFNGHRLLFPADTNPGLLAQLRQAASRGEALPYKLVHSLEAMGRAAQGVSFARAGAYGVGCSPAATAAWLGPTRTNAAANTATDSTTNTVTNRHHDGIRYLEALQDRHGGPVPVAAPLDVFERAWVVATLLTAGVNVAVPGDIVATLRDAFSESGAAGGAGLPPDADDTATALRALAAVGEPGDVACLWQYRKDDHFVTYPDERTPSVTTNAHVLQALASAATTGAEAVSIMRMLVNWLCGQQHPDGYWSDKWHASPYYATGCCVAALTECGENTAVLRKAVRWIVGTQRQDGSWGRWEGTPEETAYAVRILAQASKNRPDPVLEQAAARGCAYLLSADDKPNPPLWHDKDLYTPGRIVAAERIAAVHAASANPRVRTLIGPWLAVAAERTAS